KYLKEVQYRNKKLDKVFFGFAIQNRAGGWELRSASDTPAFKSALIAREGTFLSGSKPELKQVSVFEGTSDFLSLLTMKGVSILEEDSIILHSLSTYKSAFEIIAQQKYSKINLWLDNDPSGIKMAKKFHSEYPGCVVDKSTQYRGFRDLNYALR